MPANLTPQYHAAEEAYRRARTTPEKIEALETMMAVIPKHKGTEHLRGELRGRLARLSQEAERQAAAGRGGATPYDVKKEGCGQVAVVGLVNSGKSALVAALTGAPAKVGEYPFTTQLPFPAMMPFENAQVQLVDLPPLVTGATPPWLKAIPRRADLALLTLDLAGDPLTEWEALGDELGEARVLPYPPGSAARLEEDDPRVPVKSLIVATKADAPDAGDALELLRLEVGDALPVVPVSAASREGLDDLRARVWRALDVVRVYTKPPGRPVDRARPFVLHRGATVDDLVDQIHRDLRGQMRYALLWGQSGKFAGQRVGHGHVLEDEDVVEVYA
jgi:ribosome-interacting GTPase 1